MLGLGPAPGRIENKMKVCYKMHGNDLYAVFPKVTWDLDGNLMCYSHIGQHGAVCPRYVRESRNATPSEYANLHNELQGIYAPEKLVVTKRMSY